MPLPETFKDACGDIVDRRDRASKPDTINLATVTYTIGMLRRFLREILSASAIFLLLATTAPGDTVKLRGKPAFEHVRVVRLENGRLIFEGVSRQFLRKPLDDVSWIEIDDQPAFSDAERAAARRDISAVAAYGRAADSVAAPRWVRDLARVRLIRRFDTPDWFAETNAAYLQLCESNPDLASAYRPTAAPYTEPTSLAGPLRATLHALDGPLPPAGRTLVRAHALDLALLANVQPLPEQLGLAPTVADSEATSQPSPAPADSPQAAQPGSAGLLAELERQPAASPAPAAASEERGPALRLPADALVLRAARAALDHDDPSAAEGLLRRAEPFVASADARAVALLRARLLLAGGDAARAADALMRLTEPPETDATAAAACYYVGLAHEALQRPEVARRLYRRALASPLLPADLRQAAELRSARLGDDDATAGPTVNPTDDDD